MLKCGALLAKTSPGAMLAIKQSAQAVSALFEQLGLDMAIINDVDSCVVSGATPAIDALQERLKSQGIPCQPVQVLHPFYSRLLEPLLAEFQSVLQEVRFNPP